MCPKLLWMHKGMIERLFLTRVKPSARSTSRGRPVKRSSRSTSASRKAKPTIQKFSPPTQQQKKKLSSPPSSSLRKSKSPQKSIPKEKARKTRSTSRTRKVNTAPPAVSANKKKEKTFSRPSPPQQSYSSSTTIKTTTLTATRGAARPATASPLPFALRGSISPPLLRSRTAAALANNNQRGITHSPQARKTLKRRVTYYEQLKNSAVCRQLGKFGNCIKKTGPV
uniref:Uncharacterized protein n=1 Tax=Meloidogyne javanica TaxID=6303 RepID=A0A915LTH0_MELJA